jgi:hypothetical protein
MRYVFCDPMHHPQLKAFARARNMRPNREPVIAHAKKKLGGTSLSV